VKLIEREKKAAKGAKPEKGKKRGQPERSEGARK